MVSYLGLVGSHMAGRSKLKPVQGDVCWFCKQPSDEESWMGLGQLRSTMEPMFEGHYILYHECCAVYSNGAGEVLPAGMDDEGVLQFWTHGERCSGIGLKCQLCGLRGATTGCLHGPCQQFYHYPCARIRAFQGHLQFSLSCRSLACAEHLHMLPHPYEDPFLGMWVEGGGGWHGVLADDAAQSWLPRYNAHMKEFRQKWRHLLTMIPLDAQKSQQKKGKKKGKGGRPNGGGDPDFKTKAAAGKSARQSAAGDRDGSDTGAQRPQQQQQQQQPKALGVPAEVAEAALQAAKQREQWVSSSALSAAVQPPAAVPADPLDSGGGAHMAAQQQQQEMSQIQQQESWQPEHQEQPVSAGAAMTQQPTVDTELLLAAAGFDPSMLLTKQHSSRSGKRQLQSTAASSSGDAAGAAVPAGTLPSPAAAATATGASSMYAGAGATLDSYAANDDGTAAVAAAQDARGSTGSGASSAADGGGPHSASVEVRGAGQAAVSAAGDDSKMWQAGASCDGRSSRVRHNAGASGVSWGYRRSHGVPRGGRGPTPAAAMPGAVAVKEDLDAAVADAAGMTQYGVNDLMQQQPQHGGSMGRSNATQQQQQDRSSSQGGWGAAGDNSMQPPSSVLTNAGGGLGSMPGLEGWPSDRGTDMFTWLQQQARLQQQQQQQQGSRVGPASGWGGGTAARSGGGGPTPTAAELSMIVNPPQMPVSGGQQAGNNGKAVMGRLVAAAAAEAAATAAAQAFSGTVAQPDAAALLAAVAAAGLVGAGGQNMFDVAIKAAQKAVKEAQAAEKAVAAQRGSSTNMDTAAGTQLLMPRESSTQVPTSLVDALSRRDGNLSSYRVASNMLQQPQQQQQQLSLLNAASAGDPVEVLQQCIAALTRPQQQQQQLEQQPVLQQPGVGAESPLLHQLQAVLQDAGSGGGGGGGSAAALAQLAGLLQQRQQQRRTSDTFADELAAAQQQRQKQQQQGQRQHFEPEQQKLAKRPKGNKRPGQEIGHAVGLNQQQLQQNLVQAQALLHSQAVAAGFDGLPKIEHYFGCVSVIPALQPRELRAAGVTAHPSVVVQYIKQKNMAAALELQPWSIVVPPTAVQQLAACNVQPSRLASQLYSLLQTVNSINSSLAGSSNSPPAAAGSNGSSNGGVSGGYAGMPRDLPVRFVQGCIVPADDSRTALHNEFALKALQDIEPGTLLGPYRSYVLTDADYSAVQRSAPDDWEGPAGVPRVSAWQELLHRYTFSVKVPTLQGSDPLGSQLAGSPPLLHFCALGYGNLTCLANDPVLDPYAAGKLSGVRQEMWPPNAQLCVVLVNGLPLPLLLATRTIAKGDEVCWNYGWSYWEAWRRYKRAAVKG